MNENFPLQNSTKLKSQFSDSFNGN